MGGYFVAEVNLGDEHGQVSIVSNFTNLEEGQKVVVAPSGSKVNGKIVKQEKVGGEASCGMICGPTEMGTQGDATKCLVLDFDAYEAGDVAPKKPKLAVDDADAPDEDADPKAKGAKATEKVAKDEDDWSDDGKKGKKGKR